MYFLFNFPTKSNAAFECVLKLCYASVEFHFWVVGNEKNKIIIKNKIKDSKVFAFNVVHFQTDYVQEKHIKEACK